MQTEQTDILIIGAGLTGLTLAYYLKQLNIKTTIVEARERIGGRIFTKHNTKQAPIELGATWLTKEHSELLKLLSILNIDVFHQYYGNTAIYKPNEASKPQLVQLPQNGPTSFRIKNGTSSITSALAKILNETQIITNCVINSISLNGKTIIARSKKIEFKCKYIVSTLPPVLFQKHIKIAPALPSELVEVLNKTHTWMGESIKIGFSFKEAFWQHKNTSGTIYSNTSPLQEFYDHSNAENNLHALCGFMKAEFLSLSKSERKEQALNQLKIYYGEQVLDFLTYEELIWKNEKYTATTYDSFVMPQQNNGNYLFQNSYLDHKLFIAGTETSPYVSGKMEGAVRSAQFVFNQIKTRHFNN